MKIIVEATIHIHSHEESEQTTRILNLIQEGISSLNSKFSELLDGTVIPPVVQGKMDKLATKIAENELALRAAQGHIYDAETEATS